MVPRRALMFGAVAVIGGGAFAARWFNVGADLSGAALSVAQAHASAVAGAVLLVDIRRPDEWARTGVPQGAVPLDMRRPDFAQQVALLADGRPVALICARGVRSRAMARRLAKAGFDDIRDVPEGMLGSGAGPGWLRAGLPVERP